MDEVIISKDNFFNTLAIYPQLELLNNHFETIMNEVNNNFKCITEWHPVFENKINMYPLYFLGVWTKNIKNKFPLLCKLIEQIYGVLTVEFSILEPNCQITPHVGGSEISGKLLRCHLGLDIPDNCGFVCENYVNLHKTNDWITFDNAMMHNVFNFSSKRRIVLIIDMLRPNYIKPKESGRCYLKELLTILPNFYNTEELEIIKNNIDKDDWSTICINPDKQTLV